MPVTVVMTALCTAGVAFYLRFLFALWKECKPTVIGYWLRLRLGPSENTIAELPKRHKSMTRAA